MFDLSSHNSKTSLLDGDLSISLPDEHLNCCNREQVLRLVEIDLKATTTVGYHGTCIEAVEIILAGGALPSSTADKDGYVYFLPRRDQPEQVKLWSELGLSEEFKANTEIAEANRVELPTVYAAQAAKSVFFLRKLGLEVSYDTRSHPLHDSVTQLLVHWPTFDASLDDNFDEDWSRESWRKLCDAGVSEDRLESLRIEMSDRSGIMLGLSTKILSDFQVTDGDDGVNGDFRIHTPHGLDLSYITAMKPLGAYEQEYFRTLTMS